MKSEIIVISRTKFLYASRKHRDVDRASFLASEDLIAWYLKSKAFRLTFEPGYN